MKNLLRLLLVLVLVLAGCSKSSRPPETPLWTKERVEEHIHIGMTPDQVTAALGISPTRVITQAELTASTYLFSSPQRDGWHLGGATVIFQHGKMIRWNPIEAHRTTKP